MATTSNQKVEAQKIIRTICYFTPKLNDEIVEKILYCKAKLENYNYIIQTMRVCSPVGTDFDKLIDFAESTKPDLFISAGELKFPDLKKSIRKFAQTPGVNCNVDLAQERLTMAHADLLFELINLNPAKTFEFTYTFNNAANSPYMPSAAYQKPGLAVGLQPTNLSAGCDNLNQWLGKLKEAWEEIESVMRAQDEFLGIDSSIAPLGGEEGSLLKFFERIDVDFDKSFSSPIYTQITNFIKNENPRPIGLNGLMMPCLEDFALADAYEQGQFSIERNIFVSLHSGLGIDTYPIAVDESPKRVLDVLRLMQSLSNKYSKPLSVRFVSDGKAKVGDKTDLQNQYLKDVKVRTL